LGAQETRWYVGGLLYQRGATKEAVEVMARDDRHGQGRSTTGECLALQASRWLIEWLNLSATTTCGAASGTRRASHAAPVTRFSSRMAHRTPGSDDPGEDKRPEGAHPLPLRGSRPERAVGGVPYSIQWL